jgi:hypothetical protein
MCEFLIAIGDGDGIAVAIAVGFFRLARPIATATAIPIPTPTFVGFLPLFSKQIFKAVFPLDLRGLSDNFRGLHVNILGRGHVRLGSPDF